MKWYLCLLLVSSELFSNIPSQTKHSAQVSSLYDSLDPTSISELVAFHQLYPDTEEGTNALMTAWELINLHRPVKIDSNDSLSLSSLELEAVIALATKQDVEPELQLESSQIAQMKQISDHLHNRTLKGHRIKTIPELAQLEPKEIDLARTLLLYQYEDDIEGNWRLIEQYEASLDMMALQILAKLPKDPTPIQKLEGISHFIFHEKGYRFPPHSMWAKEVDHYTFLPSVLDSRHGVCLGVSILYLCLAQRIDLPLTIITPPGHIYLAYQTDDGEYINIETTARGIHVPSDAYLSVNTRFLIERNIKEVVGLNFMNHAAVLWQDNNYQKAVDTYKKALLFMPNDPLIYTFLSYNYLFIGEEKKGEEIIRLAWENNRGEQIYVDSIGEDYLNGKVDAESIKVAFQHVDETAESVAKKQSDLQKVVEQFPFFREGILQLATTWLQQGRSKEALDTLKKYHQIDPNHPIVEYYLAILLAQRLQFEEAWSHLFAAHRITEMKGHHPKALKEFKQKLRYFYPPPTETHDPQLSLSKAFANVFYND